MYTRPRPQKPKTKNQKQKKNDDERGKFYQVSSLRRAREREREREKRAVFHSRRFGIPSSSFSSGVPARGIKATRHAGGVGEVAVVVGLKGGTLGSFSQKQQKKNGGGERRRLVFAIQVSLFFFPLFFFPTLGFSVLTLCRLSAFHIRLGLLLFYFIIASTLEQQFITNYRSKSKKTPYSSFGLLSAFFFL